LNDALTDLAEKDEKNAKDTLESEQAKWSEEFEKEKLKWVRNGFMHIQSRYS